jgi:hypothetical protein
MSHRLLSIETPTLNGRVYSQEIANAVVEQINTQDVFVTMDTTETRAVPLDRVTGLARNARIEDGWVMIDYHPVKTPLGTVLDLLMEKKIEFDFVTCGIGTVSSAGIVSDYSMSCVAVIPKGKGHRP